MTQTVFRYKQNRHQQLRGFCYAAAAGSISKAAERMYLTQPSVSQQIQALERELGVQLFERHGPKIRLTPDGEILYDLAMPLIEGMDNLDAEFSARRGNPDRGRVDIAAGWSTILYVLPKYVEEIRRRHPHIDLKIRSLTGEEGLVQLRTGAVDFAIGPLLNVPADLVFHPLVSYDPLLITAKDHPLAHLESPTLHDISQYPFILPPGHLSTWRTVDHVFKQHGLPYDVAMEVGGWEVIKKYVELGLGISVIMSVCITGQENLKIFPANEWFPKRTYGIALRKGKKLSPPAKRVLKMIMPDLKA